MEIELHPKQSIVFNDITRFQVVAAGRRFGKSYLAAVLLYKYAMMDTKVRSDGSVIDLKNEVVYYVGPTFKQARENLWQVMMDLGQRMITNVRQNEGEIIIQTPGGNSRIIRFKGADDPDSLRGVGLHYVVMDEYAFMKPLVWEYIIRPALGRAEGGALFIGTPDFKNHFYEMHLAAEKSIDPSSGSATDEWKSFKFYTDHNPYITDNEKASLRSGLSEEAVRQELFASFEARSGSVFNWEMFQIVDDCKRDGEYVVTVDLAGFEPADGRKKQKVVLDDHAIAVAKIHDRGWHIERIYHGKWDVRETALRILKTWKDYRPVKLGIEKGALKNAVWPYLQEFQVKYGLMFEIEPLLHGNQRKEDRILWAIEGRARKGSITLQSDVKLEAKDKWVGKFLSQAVDFPNERAKRDLLDAVAYVEQLADIGMGMKIHDMYGQADTWVPLDEIAGY